MFYQYNFIAVAATAIMTVIVNSVVDAATWTEMYIPYNNDNIIHNDSFGAFGPYIRDDPLRQHLHLLKTPTDGPSPVYFFSHANGGKASGVSPEALDIFINAGYSVISWESVSQLNTTEDVEACRSDFNLVWSWFQANAAKLYLDSNSVVIGGRSRGSVCSWPMAHSQKAEIQGIYMYNVVPADNTLAEDVTTGSPPAHLVYGPECPKPITQDCVPSPDQENKHNPRFGQTIVDRYTDLGMTSKIQLTDGLTTNGIGIFDMFPRFVASLASTCTTKMSELCEPFSSLKTCSKCLQTNKDELLSAGCTRQTVKKNCIKKAETDTEVLL